MAKSSLTRTLLWAHRQIHGARKTGMPVREFTEQQREFQRGRRDFLKHVAAGSAAIAGLNLLPNRLFAETPVSIPDVAIIGAGMAGLHCAWQLKHMGCSATVYESSNRVTGRIYTNHTAFASQGMFSDLGGEYIDTDHMTMRKLAKHFNLGLYDYRDDVGIETYYDFGGVSRSTQELLEAYEPIAAEIDTAYNSFDNPAAYAMFNNANGGEYLDSHSVTSWLESIGASGWIKKLLEVGYATEFGLDTEVNNVINMIYLIGTNVAKMRQRDLFEIYGWSDERFHVIGGNDQIPQALANDLPGQIELGFKLVALAQRSDGKYVMTFANGQERVADHVVLALPFTILRTVDLTGVTLPTWKTRAINEMGYGQVTKVITGHTSRPWRDIGFVGNSFSDQPYQSSTETSRMQPGPTGILENYLAGTNALNAGTGSTDSQVAIFHNQIESVFPGVTATYNGNKIRMDWNKYEHTKAAYSSYLVGQYTTIAGAEPLRVGNIHFCGEHTTLDYQGWMEGAARSGADAAHEVGADLKLCAPRPRNNERRGHLCANG